MDNRKQLKILLLKEILAKKEVLFGAFTPFRTKENKTEAWKGIHAVAQSLQLAQEDKPFTYTRDVIWQNIKKASMKKRDNSRQTGSAGGPNMKVNDIDELVYEIIGPESPVLDGIDVPESVVGPVTDTHPKTNEDDPEKSGIEEKENKLPPPVKKRKIVKAKVTKNQNSPLLPNLKEEKLKLTIEYLKLKIKKTKKEIAVLDTTVGKTQNSQSSSIRQESESYEPLSVDDDYEEVEYLSE